MVQRRGGPDLDLHAPRRGGLAGRRAGDRRRRGLHGRCAQEPGCRRAPPPARGPTSRPRPSTTRPCSLDARARPITGMLALATQPLLPAHLLADVAFADLATSDFARFPVGSGPFALTDIDATRAVLVPAAGVVAAGSRSTVGVCRPPVPRPTRSRRPTRVASAGWPHAVPRPDRGALLRRRGRPSPTALRAARSTPRPGCSPRRSWRASTAVRRARPHRVSDHHALDGHAQPPSGATRSCATPRCARPCSPPSTATALVADVLGGNATRADALDPARFVGVRRGDRPVTSTYDRKAATKALGDAGWTKKSGQWAAPGAKTAVPARDPDRARACQPPAGVPRAVRPRRLARRSGSTRSSSRSRPRTSSRASGRATSRPRSWTSPRASSRTCTRSSRRPRCASSGTNLAGYQDASIDTLLEAARKPGTRRGADAPRGRRCSSRWPRRSRMLPLAWNDEVMLARGLDGVDPEAHRRARRPVLGCASMAPRRDR